MITRRLQHLTVLRGFQLFCSSRMERKYIVLLELCQKLFMLEQLRNLYQNNDLFD
uniref:Uncharacterized protein n=1 Tax=Arundo donax TaxID=35708 RepID=A0A0A9CMH6_ARUDO